MQRVRGAIDDLSQALHRPPLSLARSLACRRPPASPVRFERSSKPRSKLEHGKAMSDRPASWRMPTPSQMEELASLSVAGNDAPAAISGGPVDMPEEYWDALLRDTSTDTRRTGNQVQQRRLCEIPQHLLRISCRRCARTPNAVSGRLRCFRLTILFFAGSQLGWACAQKAARKNDNDQNRHLSARTLRSIEQSILS